MYMCIIFMSLLYFSNRSDTAYGKIAECICENDDGNKDDFTVINRAMGATEEALGWPFYVYAWLSFRNYQWTDVYCEHYNLLNVHHYDD